MKYLKKIGVYLSILLLLGTSLPSEIYAVSITDKKLPEIIGKTDKKSLRKEKLAKFTKQMTAASTKQANEIVIDGLIYTYDTATKTATLTGESKKHWDLEVPSSITIQQEVFTVTKIGDYAFRGSTSIFSALIPGSVKEIGECAFSVSDLKRLTIEEGVEVIGNYAFDFTYLDEVILPASMKYIGLVSFSLCDYLKKVTIKGAPVIGESAFAVNDIARLHLSDEIREIGPFAFSGNRLKNIQLPKRLEKIGAGAFFQNQITTLTLPENMTSVGDRAFYQNQLQEVHVSSSLQDIGQDVFAINPALMKYFVKGSGKDAFVSASKNASILDGAVLHEEGAAKSQYTTDKRYYYLKTGEKLDLSVQDIPFLFQEDQKAWKSAIVWEKDGKTLARNVDTWQVTMDGVSAEGVYQATVLGEKLDPITVVQGEEPVSAPVTVTYRDAQGNSLAPDDVLHGIYGDAYTATEKTIPGYRVTTPPENQKGTFTAVAQTVSYVYKAVTAKAITIRHINEFGELIRAPEVLEGIYGDVLEVQANPTTEYQLWKAPGQTNYTFSEEAQTITFQYAKDIVPPGSTYRSLFKKEGLIVKAVMAQFGDFIDDPVTQEKMDQVKELIIYDESAWFYNVEMDGLKYAHHLRKLVLKNWSYFPLPGYLGTITNLDALANLADLEEISLEGEKIEDITGLDKLSKLKHLNLVGNLITDLTPLTQMPKLTYLDLARNLIKDASPLAGITQLEYLNLSQNQVEQLEPFVSLTNLQELYLGGPISDFRLLDDLPLIHNPEAKWRFDAVIQLPDAIAGEPIFMQAFDPFGRQITFSYSELDGSSYFAGKYDGNAYATFFRAGDGQVTFIMNRDELNTKGYVRIEFHQRILPSSKAGAPVTVRYVDGAGATIAEEETLEGTYGYAFQADIKEIAGYKPKHYQRDATGYFSDKAQTVAINYEKEVVPEAKAVTVNYVDESGQMIAARDVFTGTYGETYEAEAKEIEGYQLLHQPDNITGTFTEQEQTVTFVYKKEAVPEAKAVTVNYVDESGQAIAEHLVLTGVLGDSYIATALEILGYQLKETPSNASGTFSEEAQTVTFIYKKQVEPEAKAVTVNYVDEQGQTLAASNVLEGAYGEPYQAHALKIAEYTIKTVPANAVGTFTDSTQTVTFVYMKQSEASPDLGQGAVDIVHMDETGKMLAVEQLVGNIGEIYMAQEKAFAGYHIQTRPTNQTGAFTSETQTVTFLYKKNEGLPSQVSPPTSVSPSPAGHGIVIAPPATVRSIPKRASETKIPVAITEADKAPEKIPTLGSTPWNGMHFLVGMACIMLGLRLFRKY
ncbi:MucBP domain-containing protein [Listeria booriae]|uniref:MucBP domain-containing protein n=1 Tax=Listeria booriae TaxID=1552123 RepID=UPI001628035C|nr:MucBP domain-containing protein [Listeria booriae]MBC2148589.1 leucine-rich repeat protein [Listeria booriae]MBC2196536.1 leucine-rich repeat protein [Listeria booriae]